MRFQDEFRSYLKDIHRSPTTGKPLAVKVATDILSRCRLIEKVLDFELGPRVLFKKDGYETIKRAVKQSAKAFGASSGRPYAYNQHLYALRHYVSFLQRME
jgi:hypothetical protein